MAECCGDRRGLSARGSRSGGGNPGNPGKTKTVRASDGDFVKAKYMHQNKGSHRVVGPAVFSDRMEGVPMVRVRNGWSLDYRWRSGGDVFLVHRGDLEAAPHLFKSLEEGASAIVSLPKRKAPTPPAPTRIAPLPEGETKLGMNAALPGPEPSAERVAPTPEELLKAKEERSFDPQLVPGIGAAVARKMTADGIASEADILELGEEGLQKYGGIGPQKAKVIIEALRERRAAE